jgi:hypothetical protein
VENSKIDDTNKNVTVEILSSKVHKKGSWDKASVIISALGVMIAFFGVCTFAIQIGNTNASISNNTLEQIYGRMHSINMLFVDRPELKPYFYDGMEINDPNPIARSLKIDEAVVRARVPAVAEMMCDFFAQALIELKRLPEGAYQGWVNYIQSVYLTSPVLRQYYQEHKEWYQYQEAGRVFDEADRILAAKVKLEKR